MLADWMTAQWDAPAHVRTLLTTRLGGVSAPPFDTMNLGSHVGDEDQAVAHNRSRLCALLPSPPCWLQQVHGTRVVEAHPAVEPPQADGSYTRRPGRVCAVLVADCLPILLCDRAGSAVAVAHAGWRGLSAGVLEHTVRALPAAPGDMLAYLGPAIGPDAFEVGADVLEAFIRDDPGASACFRPRAGAQRKWLCDLFVLARRRLLALGVRSIAGGGLCTYSLPQRFFSHRRDRRTGRQAALIWLEP